MIKELNDVKLLNKNNVLYCFKNNIINNYLITAPKCRTKLEYKKLINLDEAFLFNNRWDHNFRHFIIETFCGIHKFLDKKIIIKENCPKHNYQTLQILGLEKNIIRIKNNECYNIKKLYVTTNKRIQFTKEIDDFIKLFIKKCRKMSSIKLENKHLYLSREKYDQYQEEYTPKRWITNFEEIKYIFDKFNKIETHNMDLWDQVSLINQAENIITIIGAGCDNYIFTNSKCYFIVLYPRFCRRWSKFLSEYNKGIYLGIQCGIYNNTIKYNPKDKTKDPLNGPWICFDKIIFKTLKKNLIWKKVNTI